MDVWRGILALESIATDSEGMTHVLREMMIRISLYPLKYFIHDLSDSLTGGSQLTGEDTNETTFDNATTV